MKSAKTIKKTVIGLLCLCTIASIGLNIYQHYRIMEVSQDISNETAFNTESTTDTPPDERETLLEITEQDRPPATGETQAADREAEDLRYQIAAAKEELAMVNEQISDEETKKAEQLQKEYELAKERMEDPDQEETWRNVYKASNERQYILLLKKLNLPQEKQEKFIEILVNERMASREETVEIIDDPDLGKRVVTILRGKDVGDEYQDQIRELLGYDNYEEYKEYKKKGSEVNILTRLNESIIPEYRLTDDQQFEMIDAMYEKAEKERAATVIDDNKIDISEEIMEERARIHEAYVEAAQDILSQTQIEQLKAYLKQQRESTRITVTRSSRDTTEQENDGGKPE